MSTATTQPQVPVKVENRVADLLKANKDKIMACVPKHLNADRLMRVAMQAVSSTPMLQQCSASSLFSSIVRASMMGLEPNGPLGEGYLIPFRNNGKYEAQFMPSYRGLINCARRSGDVKAIYAHAVHAKDRFEMELGTTPFVKHVPAMGERGEHVGCYAVFTLADGTIDFEYMPKSEIDAIRNRSKASNSGPWVTDYMEMAKKTVIRRLLKRAPMSVDTLAQALEVDNAVAVGERSRDRDAIEVAGIEVPDDDGPTVANVEAK